jgi:hypothetical protein
MWSFLKHYDEAQPGKRKTASVLNRVNFSKFGIPSWIWLLFFGAWFQLFGLFWMVTGLPIFRPLPVLMKLDTESTLLD